MVGIHNGEASKIGVHDAYLLTRQDPSFGHFLRFVAMRRLEEEGDAYESLAANTADCAIKTFFLTMADFKAEQATKIREYGENGRNSGEGFPLILPARKRPEPPASIEEACRMALRFELDDYCLYIHLAELEDDPSTRNLFLLLIQVHKSNLQYIENRLHAVAAASR